MTRRLKFIARRILDAALREGLNGCRERNYLVNHGL